MMLNWISKDIESKEDAIVMIRNFKRCSPTVAAFDTETTGLHIINDVPFLFQFGWINEQENTGYTYLVDLEETPKLAREVIDVWQNKLACKCTKYLGHNVKFDLHMMTNISQPYTTENVSDTMFYIRLAHDALTPEKGGPPLGLKAYAAQYISPNAKLHETKLADERRAIAKAYNMQLKERLGADWTLAKIEEFFKDKLLDVSDMPEHLQAAYNQWLASLPDWLRTEVHGTVSSDQIRYNKLNRKNVKEYAHKDIVWTLEIYRKLAPIVELRGNQIGLKMEEDIIFPLVEMERVGFFIDKEYLHNAKDKMKAYIIRRRDDLNNIAGQPVKVGQHALIKQILLDKFNLSVQATGKEDLSRVASDLKHTSPNHPAIPFIETILELRTLEKWYATYIMRFVKGLRNNDRLYTQINQVGAVSGRVTSDFQQFPKDTIKTIDGEPLFSPRQMVRCPGGDYDGLVYIDYSQIELRLQAMYTILVGHPEPNLCKAYMPYGCVNEKGETFDPYNNQHIRDWRGKWYDGGEQWKPLDVHAATTCLAFGITPEDPMFKRRRYDGKRINFAKNYGAQFGRIKQMFPEYTDEQIKQIDEAYYKAFPGVKAYHDYCYKLCLTQSHGTNLFGVKYYGVSGHNMINMLIQGSGAYFLKWKIRQLYDYSKAHNIKSRFQMNIHDELSWEKHKDESIDIFYEFQRIMETWNDSLVPLVAEMEVSTSTWANKKGL